MFRNIIMDGNENIPTDFFKGIKISLKNVLKHHDINLPKITNAVIQCNDVVVCYGDFEQKQHMKFKEPIKGKGIRTLFRKAGFNTYLVDEFRTSCRYSNCEIGICSKMMIRENPRPFRTGNILVHGLICCKNKRGYWNRDVNGVTNIYKIAYNAINNIERPNYLSRNKNSSADLDESAKPKFTRSETGKPY